VGQAGIGDANERGTDIAANGFALNLDFYFRFTDEEIKSASLAKIVKLHVKTRRDEMGDRPHFKCQWG
jgi:hypothetical protein